MFERCDRCCARAQVEVLLPSGNDLRFCAHHYAIHLSALEPIAFIKDLVEV